MTYTLRVTNTGTVTDVIVLTRAGPITWTVSYSTNPLNLGAGAGMDVDIYIGIPSGVPFGSSGVITIIAISQGDPTQNDAAVLTTDVPKRYLYLPVVMRQYLSP